VNDYYTIFRSRELNLAQQECLRIIIEDRARKRFEIDYTLTGEAHKEATRRMNEEYLANLERCISTKRIVEPLSLSSVGEDTD
jgi:hypothetical protein